MKKTFRLIAKALGEKSGKNDKEADKIAVIRFLITSQILITNGFIVYGVLKSHHFPKEPKPIQCVIIDK